MKSIASRNHRGVSLSCDGGFKLDIIIDQGRTPAACRLNLPHFTLIGATTRSGFLTAPLLTRFGMRERLDYYVTEDLEKIVVRSARLLNVEMNAKGAHESARRSRGTPRNREQPCSAACRDFAQVRHNGRITAILPTRRSPCWKIDQNGLDEMDKRILEAIIVKFGGGPWAWLARRGRRRRAGHDRGSL